MTKYRLTTNHYRLGRFYEEGEIVEIPDTEKPASYMVPIDAPIPEKRAPAPEPSTLSEIQAANAPPKTGDLSGQVALSEMAAIHEPAKKGK